MQYIMAPLEEHYDDGFGAVGETFIDAAKELAKASGGERIFWNHLPEVFLLRHAIELFLKSGIIIIHRKLKIPYDSEPHSSANPMLLTSAGTWKPLLRTHDLLQLYAYWKKLITESKEKLTVTCSSLNRLRFMTGPPPGFTRRTYHLRWTNFRGAGHPATQI